KRNARFYNTVSTWNAELLGTLSQGLKAYIPMFSSPETAESLHRELSKLGYRGKCFSRLLSEEKKKDIFGNVNNAVDGLDYLIATPVMTCECVSDASSSKNLKRELSPHINRSSPELSIFTPNPLLETQLYNVSKTNLSKNDFVGTLANCFRECEYEILNGEVLPAIYPEQTAKVGAELSKAIRANKKDLDLAKCKALADAPNIDTLKAAEIMEALDNEIPVDETSRLALQKFNLASFYHIEPEKISEIFVADYAKPEMKKAFSGLSLSLLPQEELYERHKEAIKRDSREKASCTSTLLHIITLDEILRRLGFTAGIYTTYPVSRTVFETHLQNFIADFKANECRYYASF
ncbi:9120_t:CDS:2, partial [Funneliformis mosseae]